jgi:hypothetical protein
VQGLARESARLGSCAILRAGTIRRSVRSYCAIFGSGSRPRASGRAESHLVEQTLTDRNFASTRCGRLRTVPATHLRFVRGIVRARDPHNARACHHRCRSHGARIRAAAKLDVTLAAVPRLLLDVCPNVAVQDRSQLGKAPRGMITSHNLPPLLADRSDAPLSFLRSRSVARCRGDRSRSHAAVSDRYSLRTGKRRDDSWGQFTFPGELRSRVQQLRLH